MKTEKINWVFVISIISAFLSACTEIHTSLGVTTPTEEVLKINISKTVYPTVSPTELLTFTPFPTAAIQAKCPPIDPIAVYEPGKILFSADDSELIQSALDFLNIGGTPQKVIEKLMEKYPDVPSDFWNRTFYAGDLTGDSEQELLITHGKISILGCESGMYQVLFTLTELGLYKEIIEVVDMNSNGIPEIVIGYAFSTGVTSSETILRVLEWNSKIFKSLVKSPEPLKWSPLNSQIDSANMTNGKVEILDLDQNGTKELVISGGIPFGPGNIDFFLFGPWRKETKVFMWNGRKFVLQDYYVDPPIYRYQAVQDGDRASINLDFDKAMDFYHQAIFDEELESWSPEQREFLIKLSAEGYFEPFGNGFSGTPTPYPPAPNPEDRLNLTAYSYYRIMLLHVLQGFLDEALRTYAILLDSFPEANPGYSYARLAIEFMTEYQNSNSISNACEKVVEYVEEYQDEILSGLGNEYFGYQNLHYQPEDICPFK